MREALVTAMYQNLFNREPDAAGLEYWVNGDGATVPANKLILALINGAQDNDDGNDATIMENKAAVGLYFADQGLNDIEKAKEVMVGVTADPDTVESAKATIDTILIADVTTDAEALQLTIASDLITGTANDDTINGLVGTNEATGNLADTFQSVDIIDGGAGNDTLNVSIASAN